jgi:hypothetical protein
MPPMGFKPMISAGERAQTDALDRAATGTGDPYSLTIINYCIFPDKTSMIWTITFKVTTANMNHTLNTKKNTITTTSRSFSDFCFENPEYLGGAPHYF